MMKHVAKSLMLMALVVSTVWGFVGCKDYDEDAIADLKSRITNEMTLREALQIQVNELKALVESMEKCQCNLEEYLTKKEAEGTYVNLGDLADYLKKTDAESTYLKISEYIDRKDEIEANKAAIELLKKAIAEINKKLEPFGTVEQIVNLVTQVSTMNATIEAVKGMAQEALTLAKNAHCDCDLTDLTQRVGSLETLLAGWDQTIRDLSEKVETTYAKALKNAELIEANQKSIEELTEVIRNLPGGGGAELLDIIKRIKNLEDTRYTKKEVDKLISLLQTSIAAVSELAGTANANALEALAKAGQGGGGVDPAIVAEAIRIATEAQTAAAVAQTAASNAQTAANEAKQNAATAQTAANNAQNDATEAKTTAQNAQTASTEAKTTANEAKTAAESAQSAAGSATTAAQAAQTAATAAQTAANTAQTTANTANQAAGAAQNAADAATTTANAAKSSADAAATTATAAKTAAEAAQTAAEAAKTAAESAAALAQTSAANAASSAASALTAAQNAQTAATNASEAAVTAATKAGEAAASAAQAASDAQNAATTATQANATANAANTAAAQAKQAADDALAAANTASTNATQALTTATAAQTRADDAWTLAQTANQSATNATIAANNAQNAANNAQTAAENAQTAANTATTTANNAKTAAENAQTAAEAAQTAAEAAQADATDALNKIAALDTRVGDLEEAIENFVTKEEFQEAMDKVNERVDSLATVTKAIEKEVDKLKEDIQNMITGITVQGTQSPVIGYFNTPFDARSTMLAVYFGTPINNWRFPTLRTSNYVKESDFKWNERNIEILGEGVFDQISGNRGVNIVTLDGAEGNAGTLYVTVNPSNVDFSGQTLKLKDSQDGDAPATLSPLARSERLLTMGFTRAAADNGFYEAPATITANDVDKVKFEIDYESLEQNVKDLVNEHNKSSILDMGATLISSLKTSIPAYAVMGSWTDKSSGTDAAAGTEHKIYSQYNIASLAVKPLSFAFMQDYKFTKMPGLEELEEFVGDIVEAINLDIDTDLPDFTDWGSRITFTDFSLPDIDYNKFKVKVTKTFTLDDLDEQILSKYFGKDLRFDAGRNGKFYIVFDQVNGEYVLEVEQTYNDGSTRYTVLRYNKQTGTFYQDGNEVAHVVLPLEFEVEINVDKSQDAREVLQQLLDAVNAKVGANGSLSAQVKDLLNEIASIGNLNDKISTSIGNTKDDIKAVLDSYVTRLNNKVTGWLNQTTSIFHLALIANTGSKVSILSQTKKNPTNASDANSLTLCPTTYNLELLAPAYKKFVAVTDVFNPDGSEMDIQTAKSMANEITGENLKQVIEGDAVCKMNAGERDYIYEISYTAIDYFGKISMKKYYVRF